MNDTKSPQLASHDELFEQSAQVIAQMYERKLEPAGLKTVEFGVLKALAAFPGLSAEELAGVLMMDDVNLTHTLKILQDRKWVISIRDKDKDRLEYCWLITDQGRDKLHEALPLWKEAQKELAKLTKNINILTNANTDADLDPLKG